MWLLRDSQRRLLPWVAAALLLNAAFFLALIDLPALGINPFTKLPPGDVMSDGAGLNPLLQHPLMLIHPVVLYSGFTGFSVPFAFAFAALMTNRHERRVAARDAPLDAGAVVLPLDGNPARRTLGLRSARLGRLLGVGSGRERVVHAVAAGDRVSALGDDPGKARHAEDLEHGADRAHLLAVPLRHLPHAQRRDLVGALVHRRRLVRLRVPRLRRGRGARLLRVVVDVAARACAAPTGSSRWCRARRASCSTTGCSWRSS